MIWWDTSFDLNEHGVQELQATIIFGKFVNKP